METSKSIHIKSPNTYQWKKKVIKQELPTKATSRLQKSVEASHQLIELGRKKLTMKDDYYKKNILILEMQTKIMENQANTLEKIITKII